MKYSSLSHGKSRTVGVSFFASRKLPARLGGHKAFSFRPDIKTPFDLLKQLAVWQLQIFNKKSKGVPTGEEKSLTHTRWDCKYHIVFCAETPVAGVLWGAAQSHRQHVEKIMRMEKCPYPYEQFGDLKFKYQNREVWCRGYYVDTVEKYDEDKGIHKTSAVSGQAGRAIVDTVSGGPVYGQ